MEDQRIHPTNTIETPPSSSPKDEESNPAKPVNPLNVGQTFVVRFPKEQILRYPPPENARRYEALTRSKNKRSTCRRCCCYSLCILLLLIIAAGISAGVMYLVFRFRAPKYSITNLTTTGLNLTSAAPVSPGFDVTVRAENPNRKVGIYYLSDSAVRVFYQGLELSNGVLPVFFQPRRNVTVVQTVLTGSDVVLGGNVRTGLRDDVNRGSVPLTVRIKAPVKIRVGSVNTWKITVRVRCDVVLDGLSQTARIVSNDCGFSVRIWPW